MSNIDLRLGDSREILKTLDENSVDSIVCDPPYHLQSIVARFGNTSVEDSNQTGERAKTRADGYARLARGFMGKEWDGGDIAFDPEFWSLCLRVLKPGGHLLAFSAARNYHRMACAIEDAGFEIRDQIMWLYGSGFPKSHDISKAIDKHFGEELITTPKTDEAKQWQGWGTALKPSHEPIVFAKKPISEKSIVENVLKHGTGGINIDSCRVKTENGCPKKRETPRAGFWKSDENIKSKLIESDKGRWPANVIHDCSDVVVSQFPNTNAGGSVSGNEPSPVTQDIYGKFNERKSFQAYGDEGSASRFFYVAKPSDTEKNEYIDNTHPTIKPLTLMSHLVTMVTPKSGICLDPFMGSGTTGMAAKQKGFNFIGIEREEEYFKIAETRIKNTIEESTLEDLFANE